MATFSGMRGSGPNRCQIQIRDYVSGGKRPNVTEAAVDNAHEVMAAMSKRDPNHFTLDIQHDDATHLICEWQRVGPTAGYAVWMWRNRAVALSIFIAGEHDCADEIALRRAADAVRLDVDHGAVANFRTMKRPALGNFYIDPDAAEKTGISVLAIGLAQVFLGRVAAAGSRGPLGYGSTEGFESLCCEMAVTNEVATTVERWYSIDADSNDSALDEVVRQLSACLISSPAGFEFAPLLPQRPGVSLTFRTLADGAAFAEIMDPGKRDSQLVLLLAGINREADTAAIDATVKTFGARLTGDFGTAITFARSAHRPFILIASDQVSDDFDPCPWAVGVAFFRRWRR